MEKRIREDELLKELAMLQENPMDDELTPEYIEQVFKSIEDSDLILEFLRITMGQDMRRYFNAANDEERARCKGAFARTAYLRSKIMHPERKSKEKEE